MNNQYQLIKDVHPGDVGWTVKVTIAEKSPARTAKKSPKKYQNIILMDSEGSTVQATLYDHNIIAFQDELIQGKTYLISNALVKLTNLEYRSQSGDTQWTISGKTRIQQVDENNSALLLTAYNFIDFEDLENHMDTNTDISIIGMVIDTRPKRMIQTRSGNQCQVQDIILVNKRAKVYLQLMDSTGYINATAIGEPAESFLLCNANTLMNHSVSNPDSNIIDLIRLATEEEKTFYIKAIQQNEEATEFKYELLFVLGSDSTVTAGNQQSKDKGKSPMVEDEQSQQMDSKDVTTTSQKISIPNPRNTSSNQEKN
ncbi:Replication protein A 70 kDa DNA-binding subunit B [Abeliophyllum distichum]|uniref:Replication protein A 70 kDa DNA-binding subunit B n=1 Tax=Abeliophyllum distichum TaxID=126358 RepID=A0ABD1P6B5_9LAMI